MLAGLCVCALVPDARAQEAAPKWGAFLDIGGKVGTQRSIGQATLFVPVLQDERSMLFGDVRFQADDQNSQEGNFGLGARRMLAEGWNAGVYGFFDHRRTPLANLFNQLTFGAEMLGTNFDFRANTYWPVGAVSQAVGTASPGTPTASVVGSTVQVFTPATLQRVEYALRGFDAEAGVRIPITPAESPYNLRFYAGGFRFDEPGGAVPVVAGPRLRMEFTDYQVAGLWNGTRFTVGAEWQTDAVRGSQFFAGLRLRVPLQPEPRRASFTLQERRMTDAIVRDVDIVANAQVKSVSPAVTETASATASGRPLAVIDSASTSGAALPAAVANAGANATVILSGTFNTTATTTLQAGQTLVGAGALSVRTPSGRTATAYLPGGGIAGTTGDRPTVTLASNSTLTGLTISNVSSGADFSRAVQAISIGGATISNSTLSATATGTGIAIAFQSYSTVTDLTVTDNTITASGVGGSGAFGLSVSNTSMVLTRNIIRATGRSGFGIDIDSSSTATVSNNTVTAIGTPEGYYVRALSVSGSTATVSGNTLSASGVTAPDRNYVVDMADAVFNPGSTGNINHGGICNTSYGSFGTIGFTDGTPCPSGISYGSGGGGSSPPLPAPPPPPPIPPPLPGP